jgi:hypothetical protein
VTSLDRYARMARQHWQKFRPRELATIPDPEAFFPAKGRELEQAMITAEEALEETLPAEPDYPARVGQLKQIAATALEQATREVFGPPEDGPDPVATNPMTADLEQIRRDLNQL